MLAPANSIHAQLQHAVTPHGTSAWPGVRHLPTHACASLPKGTAAPVFPLYRAGNKTTVKGSTETEYVHIHSHSPSGFSYRAGPPRPGPPTPPVKLKTAILPL